MIKNAHLLYNYLETLGLSASWTKYLNMLILLILTILIVSLIDYIIRKAIRIISIRVAKKSKTKFDDLLIANKVPKNLAHIIPVFLVIAFIPIVFKDFEIVEIVLLKAVEVFGIVLTLWIVRALLNTFKDYFKTLPNLKDKPIDSYIQVFMIFAWIMGFVLAFAIITDTSIWKFFTALGAASAVLILVFRDTILGFVASLQVSVNDMVRIGDWITFEKYGADGDVTEINLATVKVQNFDKTITTIPTYALISDSFKNWRGMTMSNGRRIKRSLIIKQESIKFLTPQDYKELTKIELIANYIKSKEASITRYNNENNIDKSMLLNGRNLTNLGVFRKYIDAYLNSHSAINKDMIIMVRHLSPTPQGIPIEIYAFSNDKRWEHYEYIMADIFDHVLAAVPYFNLELFELPSSIQS